MLVWQKSGTIKHHVRDEDGLIATRTLRSGDMLRFEPPGFEVKAADLLSVGG